MMTFKLNQLNQTFFLNPIDLDYYTCLLFYGLSCHGRLWKTKRPMADHLLREDCGFELLYNKQLNQEQHECPVGRKAGEGVVEGSWSG